jgi:hypothetical protein
MIACMTVIGDHRRRNGRFTFALALAVVASAAGCTKGPNQPAPLEGSNLSRLAMLCTMYVQQHNNTAPPNEQELIKFAKSLSPEGMKKIGVDVTQVEQYLTSPRDKKPYRIIFRIQAVDPANPPVIAYEQVGVGGKREVGFMFGRVEEVDEARFRQLVPAR